MKAKLRKIAAVLVVVLMAVVAWYLWDTLRPRTRGEQLAAIIHDEDSRKLTDRLTTSLKSSDPEIRIHAALAIGRIGGAGTGSMLLDLVADSSLDVGATAAFALGLTGETQVVDELLDRALELPSVVAEAAVVAAGRLADSSMLETAEAIGSFLSHPSPDVREAACYGLFYAGAASQADSIIHIALNDPDPTVRSAGLYTLARLGIAGATQVYIENLADPDPFVRIMALRGLGRTEAASSEQYLAIALNDQNDRVIAQAIASLSRKKSKAVTDRLIKKLESEKDEKLIVALIDALTSRKAEVALDVVAEIMETEPPVNILIAALGYLAAVQNERAVGLIDSLGYQQVEPRVRAACAQAFGKIGSESVIPRLAVLFSDEDPIVRVAAFSNLIELDSGNVDFYLKKALHDPYYVLNVLAIDQIKEKKLSGYLPALQTMLDRGSEIDSDIRRSIVDAVRPFIEPDPRDSLAMKLLISGILDPEYIVRREAAEVYRDLLDENRLNMVPPAPTRLSTSRLAELLDNENPAPYALISTNRGEIEIELLTDVAPLTTTTFMDLVRGGLYNGLRFHRVVPNFVVQGGDPMGDGWGGPGFYIRCEYSSQPFRRGTVGIATSGKDTGGSQFFITLTEQPHLDARYTVFGQVVSGMEIVDQIVQGDEINSIVIREGAL
jgi:cyclophilin family peptidyl-prolyl cis-trans isomerase